MNWKIIYRNYLQRHPNVISKNKISRIKTKYPSYFKNLYNTEIREISLDSIYYLFEKELNLFKSRQTARQGSRRQFPTFAMYVEDFLLRDWTMNNHKHYIYKVV